MPGITLNKLRQIEKSLEAVFEDDEDQLDAIGKSIDGLKAAIKKGESVTMDDVSDILGDVMVEIGKGEPAAGTGDGVEAPNDPLAPVMLELFGKLFDGNQIRKGVTPQNAQELFDKAYTAMLGELDGAIQAAAEATAIELGKGKHVNFGKARRPKPKDDEEDPEDCDEDQDMEKLLKGLGVPSRLIKKIGTLQGQVEQLQTERDLEAFSKTAEELGEPASFGAELLKLHKVDPKLADSIKKRLGTKNAALKKSGMWAAEIGGEGGAGGASAFDQLTAKANEMVEKGSKGSDGKVLTFAKAFTEATHRNPDLYQEYRDEQRRGRR